MAGCRLWGKGSKQKDTLKVSHFVPPRKAIMLREESPGSEKSIIG